jgi:hypothetical protein
MNAHLIISLAVVSLSVCACSTFSADLTVKRRATSEWMVEQEKAWAEMACGGKWVANELFADDFQGTSPNGGRYGRPTGQPTYDQNTKWSTDCRLDEADVRYFGAGAAVVYGKESKTVPLAGGKQERRCLVWTDTWLQRKGKWQIIAVQDSRIDCPAK